MGSSIPARGLASLGTNELGEMSAALREVGILIEAGSAGGEKHHLTGLGFGASKAKGFGEGRDGVDDDFYRIRTG